MIQTDGYTEPIAVAARLLPPQIVGFIGSNVTRSLDALSHDNRCRMTGIAIDECSPKPSAPNPLARRMQELLGESDV